MIAAAQDGSLLLLLRGPLKSDSTEQRLHLVCFGKKRHYRKDGTCIHSQSLVAQLKSDWYRRRTWLTPFGDNQQREVRAWP